MGTYLNPGNEGFKSIKNDDYVDKSGLIEVVNNNISTPRMLSCISRPRRFGKSFAAKMLCAYYDKSCDSHDIFDGLKISESEDYETHLNKYDVIYLDMSNLLEKIPENELISFIKKNIIEEILKEYPEVREGSSFDSTLINAVEYTGNKIVMIIDEWDAPIRETPRIERDYLMFLRMLFKSSSTTPRIFSAVYMTGILPIKKDGSQSALSDFNEYTMVNPGVFEEYTGLTESEVESLCEKHDLSMEKMKQWYDGYRFRKAGSIYNPNSVMKAIENDEFISYWTQSSASDNLFDFIKMDFEGLAKTVTEIVGGSNAKIDPYDFANDLTSFDGANSVLVALVHLGYLAYDRETESVYIPNDEIRIEFAKSLKKFKSGETLKRVKDSIQLIMDTVNMNEEAVAAQIERVHEDESAALFYNNEQALRGIIKLAYFAYKDYYLNFEELPSGAGYADILYFPKKDTTLPALLIELKWNRSAEGAIEQIRKKNYPAKVKEYGGDILLVGINYDKDAPAGERKHSCVIEKLSPEA